MQTAVHQKVFHRRVSVLFAFPLIFSIYNVRTVFISLAVTFSFFCCLKKKGLCAQTKNGFTSAPFLDLNSSNRTSVANKKNSSSSNLCKLL